jgi:hypothetical protein
MYGKHEKSTEFWRGKREEKKNLVEGLNLDENITIKLMLKRKIKKTYTGCIYLKMQTELRCCEKGNEISGSINRREYLD